MPNSKKEQPQSLPSSSLNVLIEKYEKYISNIEWHIRVNKPTGADLDRCELQVNCYKETLKDLQAIAPSSGVQQPPNKDEIENEFRMIISHALLGCDTDDVSKETWDLVVSECAKFAMSLPVQQQGWSLEDIKIILEFMGISDYGVERINELLTHLASLPTQQPKEDTPD